MTDWKVIAHDLATAVIWLRFLHIQEAGFACGVWDTAMAVSTRALDDYSDALEVEE